MRGHLVAILACLLPAAAMAEEEVGVPLMVMTAEPTPLPLSLVPVIPAPIDRNTTLAVIDEMTATIQAMAFRPRLDPVSVSAATLASRWESAIADLSVAWSEQARIAIDGLTAGVEQSVATFPEGGMDFDDDSLFDGPVFDGSLRSPAAGFFGS